MTELNPPFALQNAGATHTAAGDRMMLAGLLAGASASGSLISRGGINGALGGGLKVAAQGTPNMSVQVPSGVAYVQGSLDIKQGVYACINDGTVNITITAAHATLPRIDSIIAHVYDSQYSGATNTWALEVVTGTAASTPVAPTLPSNSLLLANISVTAAKTSIVAGDISDLRKFIAAAGGIIVTTSGGKPAANTVQNGQPIWLSDTKDFQINDNGTWVTKSASTVTQSGFLSITFASATSYTQAVTFPTPFASTPKVFTEINSGAGPTAQWGSRAINVTVNGFTLFLFTPNTAIAWSGQAVNWFATT